MTRYEQHHRDLCARAAELNARIVRFAAHPTLCTRVDGVRAELAQVEAAIPKARVTAKWASELYLG